jgi:hypothetical protein
MQGAQQPLLQEALPEGATHTTLTDQAYVVVHVRLVLLQSRLGGGAGVVAVTA